MTVMSPPRHYGGYEIFIILALGYIDISVAHKHDMVKSWGHCYEVHQFFGHCEARVYLGFQELLLSALFFGTEYRLCRF